VITETQVVITAGIIVVVAVVSWCAAAWWCAGRYEEIVSDLEDERDELTRRSHQLAEDLCGAETAALGAAVIRWPGRHLALVAPEVAHEEDLMFAAHADLALKVASDGDMSVTAWTAAQAADMDAFIASLASYGPGR
jgi:hypothetical protein